MRVLVTGANGQVGRRLCELFLARGHEVLGVSRGERKAPGAWAYQSCDLGREADVGAALEGFRPETIVNPASMTEVDLCEKEPDRAYAANVHGPALLALGARKLSAHLVHVSTDYVFDGERGGYREDDAPNPRGVYAITKHMGEEAVRALCPSWSIARTAVVFGWPAAGKPNFGAWLVGALAAKQPVKLFSDQVVTPSHADNVAEMIAELAERRLGGVWHTAGAEAVDRYTFGLRVCAKFGFDPALLTASKLADLKLASPRPLRSALDTSKAATELSAKPLGLDEALDRLHRAFVGT